MANKRFSIEAIFKATDRLSAPIAKMRTRLMGFGSGASKSLKSLDERIGKIHSGLTKVATAAAAVGTVGGLAAFAIGKTGAEFEQAITAVGAVSLQTRDQIAALEAEAKRLGATTQFTATQAANAMETMSRAGFTNADILSGVGSVLNGAAAEGIEIAEMANHVSNALKGMGLETTETGRVADVLALASARTNSSIASLGESLANTASTARQFKIPLEDVVAGVALLQDVGLDASVAGSAMNVMLTQMAAPTDSLKKKMQQWGVTFKDAKGNMLPFQDVLANISLAAQKAGGNMDQVAFIAELVGMRGEKAASNLSNLFNTGKVQALTKELQGAAGAAAKMASIRMDNTIGDLTILESAIDGVKVELFETQSGPLRGIIQSMTKWVEANKSLIVFEFQVWLRRITDNFADIVKWLKRIGTAVVAFYAFAAAVKVARLAVLAYNVALKLAAVATWAWKAAVVAARLSTVAITAATWLYNAAINAGRLATTRFTVAQVAAKVAQVAVTATTWLATTAQTAYAAAATATTGAMAAIRVAALASIPAIAAQVVALAPLLVTIAAVTAAVGALALAWQQYNKLDKELAGSGGVTGTIGKMWEMGTFDPFKAHDAVMNEKARAAASVTRSQPQLVTPQERAASEARASNEVDGAIRVEAAPGTRASVVKQPRNVRLDLQPSGAF